MKYLLLMLTFASFFVTAQEVNSVWVKGSQSTDISHSRSNAIATDRLGNGYVTGSFSARPDVNFGVDTFHFMDDWYQHFFLTKVDANGKLKWLKTANGTSTRTEGKCICTDLPGNVFVAGTFNNTSVILGKSILTNDSTHEEIFIAKYDSSGNILWTRCPEGFNQSQISSIATDNFGNVYVTGTFFSATINMGGIELTNTFPKYESIFLAKYDANGNIIWACSPQGIGDNESLAVTADSKGNAILTGAFESNKIVFGNQTLYNTTQNYWFLIFGFSDMFMAKYNSAGQLLWVNKPCGTYEGYAKSIIMDDSDNAYMTGFFSGDSISFGRSTLFNTFRNRSTQFFIVKYSSGGDEIWAKGEKAAPSVASTDQAGNIYIAGSFDDKMMVFGADTILNNTPPPEDGSCACNLSSEFFLGKYDMNGNKLWAKTLGNFQGIATSMTSDLKSNLFITGHFTNKLNLGNSTLTGSRVGEDIFIGKLSTQKRQVYK